MGVSPMVGKILRLSVAATAATLLLASSAGAQDAKAPAKVDEASAETGAEAASTDRETLMKRATAYWEARITRSPKVYDFYAPPEKGGPKSLKEISEGGNIQWLEAEVQDAKIGSNWGVVYTRVKAEIPVAGAFELPDDLKERVVQSQWNKVDGEWYKKPVPRGLSAQQELQRKRAAAYRDRIEQEKQAAIEEAEAEAKAKAESEKGASK